MFKTVIILIAAVLSFNVHAKNVFDTFKQYAGQANTSKEMLSVYSAEQQKLTFDACRNQFLDGKPMDSRQFNSKMKPMALCSDNFAVVYSGASKTPIVVVEKLNRMQLQDAKGEARTDQFYADPRLPSDVRAELSDYKGHQVDRGHMAPAADAPTPRAMAQSFALSNMIPQDSENNRKVWSKVESSVRKYVNRAEGDVFVFTGPLYGQHVRKIGANGVWVPDSIFKLVYDINTKRAWAYILPNAPTEISKPVSYNEFVKITGFNFLNGKTVVE